MPLVLACLFAWPSGLFALKRFVRAGLVPPRGLVRVLGPGQLVVLQRQEDVDRAPVSGLRPLLLGVVSFARPQFVGAAFPSHRVVSLEGGHHALRLGDGRVVGVDQDVGRAVRQQLLPGLRPLRGHVDADEQLVVVLGLVDHAGDVLPLPGDEVSVQGGHVDPKVSQSPHLVIHRGKTPDNHVDVAVPPGAVAATALGSGAPLGAVLKVSDVVMESGRQNVLGLGERGEVENLKLLLVYCPCV